MATALAANDQCVAGDDSCALKALQLHSRKIGETRDDADASVNQSDAPWHYAQNCWSPCGRKPGFCEGFCGKGNACCRYGRASDPEECKSANFFPVRGWHTCVTTSAQPNAEYKEAEEKDSQAPKPPPGMACSKLNETWNQLCQDAVSWGAKDGKWDPNAKKWYSQMKDITGVEHTQATQDDFQRLFYCAPPGGKGCGLPPCQCSKPPCDSCFAGAPPPVLREVCNQDPDSIACKPPAKPLDYNGKAWPTMSYPGTGEMHVFAIGDWGGMDGTLNPGEGRNALVAYSRGAVPGPSVFPRTRWNKHHTEELCSHDALTYCYDSHGSNCTEKCGYVDGVDDKAQLLVADAMRQRALENEPQFFLNVGDNFYWGGIEKTCGTPMDELTYTAHHQFDQVYEGVYTGTGIAGKPWFSVLGNHDWGGRQFNNGWDQQIAYTWYSKRWIMPAPYYSATMDFPDQGFSIEALMIDTNSHDAHSIFEDPEHNLCGPHNPVDANCAAAGGPSSISHCAGFFHSLWSEQQKWVEKTLAKSEATWQVIVTHFPCGHDQYWYRQLHEKFGLDLLVTGHRHDQELWTADDPRNHMGGLTCFVTGGGGGISSEATPDPDNKKDWFGEGEYGFFDLTFSKTAIKVESINYDGQVLKSSTVKPARGWMMR
eukprot:TRINITY_DN88755_c0_g1_i1.p1 TRINITY_DN88755_c0_g1~~TRINITY_DN88755_c0_g1_i1.p1  ORF type:complete len:695 (+),score=100.33 TRINITY_DN88755_c0_g1_i1:129-2087(+)